jgi:hypothetical protein
MNRILNEDLENDDKELIEYYVEFADKFRIRAFVVAGLSILIFSLLSLFSIYIAAILTFVVFIPSGLATLTLIDHKMVNSDLDLLESLFKGKFWLLKPTFGYVFECDKQTAENLKKFDTHNTILLSKSYYTFFLLVANKEAATQLKLSL